MLRLLIMIIFIAELLACNAAPDLRVTHLPQTHRVSAPAHEPKKTDILYEVKKGDTLFSIAWSHSKDYRVLASTNGIDESFVIHPGQKLWIGDCANAAGQSPACHLQKKTNSVLDGALAKKNQDNHKVIQKKDSQALEKPVEMAWVWPAEGAIIKGFAAQDPKTGNLSKGLDIAGVPGSAVKAAASGAVVYAGRGLVGYGDLIIIKHNDNFLSAYAHNRRLLVKEGDRVKAGQKIAEIGSTGTSTPKLHFEIRRAGEPIDPQRLLPRR